MTIPDSKDENFQERAHDTLYQVVQIGFLKVPVGTQKLRDRK